MAEFADKRRAAILSMLETEPSILVSEVAEKFGVSKVTARNDLDALAEAGKLRRTHGGALSLGQTITVSILDRRANQHADAKKSIALRAAQEVKAGDSLLVDTGTTGLEFVRALSDIKDLTIITADLTIADFVDRSLPDAEVILLGGHLRKGHRYITGPATIHALSELRPSKSFVCPTSYVLDRGFMTNYESMAQLKRAFLGCAAKTYVLMDGSKIGKPGLFCCGTLEDCDCLITEYDDGGRLTLQAEGTRCTVITSFI